MIDLLFHPISLAIIFALVVWLVVRGHSYYQEERRRWALIEAGVDHLDGYQFEDLVLVVFQGLGYEAELTKRSRDGGIDVIAKRPGKHFLIQCKYRLAGLDGQSIGVDVVRETVGAAEIAEAGTPCIVTNTTFTANARKLAEQAGCILADRFVLAEWMLTIKDEKGN